MTDAREIGRDKSNLETLIFKAIALPGEVCGTALMDECLHDWQTRAVRTVLDAAGFRIIGPDEVDQVTLEKCAAEVKLLRQLLHSQTITLDVGAEDMAYFLAEDAIRAIGRKT